MRNWGVKTRGLICRGCTSSNTPSGRQWRLTRPEFAADAASVTARGQNCPVSPAGEQLGDRWYVAATKSGFQFTKRSNWSTVNASTPNIRWHSTLLWPRTRTCRAPNSSFSRPLTRSTVDRSRAMRTSAPPSATRRRGEHAKRKAAELLHVPLRLWASFCDLRTVLSRRG